MKPVLVVGLGNELVGDDSVGCRLVEWLALDDALRERMDFVVGGTDLLREADRMEGRERVVLIDAELSDAEPGTVAVHEEPLDEFEQRWDNAHGPSAVQAVGLLKAVFPALRETSFTLVGVALPEVRFEQTLAGRFPAVVASVSDVLRLLAGPVAGYIPGGR
jgi:hydrogenase maturation protease